MLAPKRILRWRRWWKRNYLDCVGDLGGRHRHLPDYDGQPAPG